jgi:ribonuclease P protein component
MHGVSYRAAVVVSKKVHKSAVVRNRIRRRLYEQVRLAHAESPLKVDIVFVVQNEVVAHTDIDKLTQEVQQLLKKATHMA